MNLTALFPFFLLICVLFTAAIIDIRFHRIPNWLTYPAILTGVTYHTATRGLEGLLFSVGGICVGIGVFIIPYLTGGMGAGDAKLMGAVGGFLGPKGVFVAFLFTGILGGIYAIMLLALHGNLRETGKRYWAILKTFLLTQKFIYIPPSGEEEKPRLCYGLPIALGTIISLAFYK